MQILVTGVAGFIGFHTAKTLLTKGATVIGIDNLNAYYDVNLKLARLKELVSFDAFTFHKIDIADSKKLEQLFTGNTFDTVIHLAAQAGVRYSLENPAAYIQSNLVGFANILECCRHHAIKHLVFASTSSVYGANGKYPFQETDNVDHPKSLYAATKKSNELMAHSYASLYQLPCTGLRFFTVYGPWGRPDMAYFKFVHKILNNEPIDVYNNGHMKRDFTYIDDVVDGILKAAAKPAIPDTQWNKKHPNPPTSYAPYRIYNIGNNTPVDLLEFIHEIERCVGKKAVLNLMPMQAGDVEETWADCGALEAALGYKSKTLVKEGIREFAEWYQSFYF